MTKSESSGQPFDDIRALVETMPWIDKTKQPAVYDEAVSLGRGLRPIGRLKSPLSLMKILLKPPKPAFKV